MAYEDVAIAGYGETDYHSDKDEQWAPYEYLADAIRSALADAGLSAEDVDGLSVTSHELHGENEVTLAKHFGFSCRWVLGDSTGNAAPLIGILRGAKAIQDGRAETVLVVAGDTSSPDSNMELMEEFNTGLYNYMRPYGFGGANGLFALLQSRHMHEYGTTREQLSNIAVTQREHARLNPRAIFQDPLTKEEYIEARPIVEPLHLYDCVMPCSGGGAVVLTSQENADALDTDPVYIHTGDEYHAAPTEPFSLRTAFAELDVLGESIARDDLDAFQLYDNYPIWVALQLEDLGFCPKGEGGAFVSEMDLSFDGDFPLNTGGGQLSCGQANGGGGILPTIEAIRQLRGEGDERQVTGADLILTTGPGTVFYGDVLCASAAVLGSTPPKTGVA